MTMVRDARTSGLLVVGPREGLSDPAYAANVAAPPHASLFGITELYGIWPKDLGAAIRSCPRGTINPWTRRRFLTTA
jgi:hypothetical protein